MSFKDEKKMAGISQSFCQIFQKKEARERFSAPKIRHLSVSLSKEFSGVLIYHLFFIILINFIILVLHYYYCYYS